MASDIDYWRDSYQGAVDEVEGLLGDVDQREEDERLDALDDAAAKLDRAASIKKSFKLELRLLRDKDLRASSEATLRELDDRCAGLRARIDEQRERADRRRLLGDKSGGRSEHKGNDDYLDGAARIQDQTQDALTRTGGRA